MATHGTGNLSRNSRNLRPARRSDAKRSAEARNRTLTYRAARAAKAGN